MALYRVEVQVVKETHYEDAGQVDTVISELTTLAAFHNRDDADRFCEQIGSLGETVDEERLEGEER